MTINTKFDFNQKVCYLRNGQPHTGDIASIVVLQSKKKAGYEVKYSLSNAAFMGLYEEDSLFENEEKLLNHYNIILIKIPANQ